MPNLKHIPGLNKIFAVYLQLVAQVPANEVAEMLKLKPNTVKNYVRQYINDHDSNGQYAALKLLTIKRAIEWLEKETETDLSRTGIGRGDN